MTAGACFCHVKLLQHGARFFPLLIMISMIILPPPLFSARGVSTLRINRLNLARPDKELPMQVAAVFNWTDEVPWNLKMIDVPSAWEYGMGIRQVIVAVLDTGVDLTHSDLQGAFWINEDEIPENGVDDDANGYVDDVTGWDFQDGDNLPQDEHGHGTFLAGIIAAQLNDLGLVGVAPNVSIMPVRILNAQGILTVDQWDLLADAIDYAVENGAKIIVLSIEALANPPVAIHDAIKRAKDAGVLIISPTGNSGKPQVAYPAAYPEVLAVSAVDENGRVPQYANYGEGTMLVAPGDDLNSTWLDGSYLLNRGTSFAVPHVAGVAALIWSRNTSLTVDETWNILISTTTSLNQDTWDSRTGYGLINASRAVLSATDQTLPQLNNIEIVGVRTSLFSSDEFLLEVHAADDVALFQVNLEYTFDGKHWDQLSHLIPTRAKTVTIDFEVVVPSSMETFLVKVAIRDARGNWFNSTVIDLTESARMHLRALSITSSIEGIMFTMSVLGIFVLLVLMSIRFGRKRS